MQLARTGSLLGMMLFVTACVTINIYFPSAQAEEAAREMVKDILGKEGAKPVENKESAVLPARPFYVQVGENVVNFLIPTAHAAAPDFKVNTPKIRKLHAKMKRRTASLKSYYANGAVGFTSDAMIKVRNASAIPLKERGKIKKMVKAENADRTALYLAIAEANDRPEWASNVRNTYAGIWIDEAATGWWYQDAKGKWQQK
ncbi:hypothetical protein MNBD_GAMMA26-1458 [hydrothermal vent metagenome]|uniref:DUF1318 domain-containing protein n=1 Tax=hydrothermal vent metagenome TaxID=652676 RepID=A0A3B1BHD6_9ZZZZ